MYTSRYTFNMRAACLLVSVAIKLVLIVAAADDNLVITLPDGRIRGTTYTTPNNVMYYGWTKIPYAGPPVGDLRFQAPQPPRPWNGILDATQEAPDCISIYHWTSPGVESEDCLYLNVYTPVLEPSERLPVMIYIYGGGYNSGSSAKSIYGPDFLIEEDVVIVTFNYRVNSFGFLSTADSEIPGNAGLKDQRQALRWTHDNIKFFGGDPERTTIFGESAGGASVGFQLISSSTAGLYRAAIAQSGTAITQWAIQLDPRTIAFALADTIGEGNYGNDTQKLTQFLQEKTVGEIVNATNALDLPGAIQPSLIWPVIEVENEDAFLTDAPYAILESGRFNQVPLIIGICAAEWLYFLANSDDAAKSAHLLDSDFNAPIPYNLRQQSTYVTAVSDAIHNIYLGEGETFSSNYGALIDFFSDNFFTRSVIKHAELAAKYVPVYLYQFSRYGRIDASSRIHVDGYETAGHSDDLQFLFYHGLNDTDATNLSVQNKMVKLWTNFAKVLNPTPERSELLDNIIWPSIRSAESHFLNINSSLSLESGLKRHSYLEWNQIYDRYGEKPFVTF